MIQCFIDADRTAFKVQIGEGKRQQFAAPHTRIKKRLKGSMYPYVLHALDKAVILL